MSHPSALSGVFGQPFAQQVAFFRQKLDRLVPTQRWDDMQGEAHDTGFMVAGAAEADLLTDLAAAVDKAIAEGRGLDEFRADFKAIVARNGWTGWTGEGSVQGEAWRVKTILRTNAYTSYSAGRHAQLLEGDFAFWVYRHGDSREPRPQHLDWNGLMLPPSHAFWIKFYPPSDWGCSCYVVGARSERGAKRLGGDPAKQLAPGWDRPDPATGEPKGIGKGWGYAPGRSVAQTVQAMAGKVRHWDYQIAKAYLVSLPAATSDALSDAYRSLPSTADDLRRYAQRVLVPDPDLPDLPPVRTMGLVRSDQAAEIARLKDGLDVRGFDYTIAPDLTRHVFNDHGPASKDPHKISADDFALLPRILSDPDTIEVGQDSSLGNLKRVLFQKVLNGRQYEAVMEIRGGRRSLYLKTFYVVRNVR